MAFKMITDSKIFEKYHIIKSVVPSDKLRYCPNSQCGAPFEIEIDLPNSPPKLQNFKLNYLKESGFIIVTDKLFKIILDVGSIGPNYIPGHAHADTLSFEMCFKNDKFIVNSGISTYQSSAHPSPLSISHAVNS